MIATSRTHKTQESEQVLTARRVYHFLPVRWALDDIKRKRIKLSRFADLNDPFELEAVRLPDPELERRFCDFWFRTYGLLCCCNAVQWWQELLQGRASLLENDGLVLRSEAIFKEMLATKYDGWQYEQEVRMISYNHTIEDGLLLSSIR